MYCNHRTTCKLLKQGLCPNEHKADEPVKHFMKMGRDGEEELDLSDVLSISSSKPQKFFHSKKQRQPQDMISQSSMSSQPQNRSIPTDPLGKWKAEEDAKYSRREEVKRGGRHCKHGADCGDLRRGTCTFIHTEDEMAMARQSDRGPTSKRPNAQGPRPCKFGAKCHELISGSCRFQHSAEELLLYPR